MENTPPKLSKKEKKRYVLARLGDWEHEHESGIVERWRLIRNITVDDLWDGRYRLGWLQTRYIIAKPRLDTDLSETDLDSAYDAVVIMEHKKGFKPIGLAEKIHSKRLLDWIKNK